MNRCEKHFPAGRPSILFADTAVCSVCSEVCDVWDVTVIELYTILGISDSQAHSLKLPRLRDAGFGAITVTIEQIETMVHAATAQKEIVQYG